MSLGMAHVITLHQNEATWALPISLQTRVSNFTEEILLTTIIITRLILTSLYHGINRHQIEADPLITNKLSYVNGYKSRLPCGIMKIKILCISIHIIISTSSYYKDSHNNSLLHHPTQNFTSFHTKSRLIH